MKLSVQQTQIEKYHHACVVIGVYENEQPSHAAAKLNQMTEGAVKKCLKSSGFLGKLGQTLSFYHVSDFNHVLFVGCGKQQALAPMAYRKIITAAMKGLAQTAAKTAVFYMDDIEVNGCDSAWKAKQLAECASEALYRFDLFKTEKEPVPALKEIIIHHQNKATLADTQTAAKQGMAIGEAVSFTKNLGNLPSNICTPSFLADQALELKKSLSGLKVKILSEKDMQKLNMGALLAVSQGSAEEAKLICLEYNGGSKKQAPIAFVGKGITFDTGGNSLKSPDNMVGMKYDMCGAATVLGVFKAALSLKLPINLVGLIPAVENMPGGTAYKPEDILTSMSGQTIEVISTDAEGRLILSDALTYCERYKPEAVIDIATLTGAVVIALGYHATGVMTNHEPLAEALLKAGETSNDRAWQLPLWDEYQEQIKSPFADMANTGGRSAGSITAGCFLSRFTQKYHWAHLDVAGTAAMMSGTSERMATGRPVPMLVQYLLDRVKTRKSS